MGRLISVIMMLLLVPAAYANDVVVLQYHHVSTDTPAVTSISPEQFAEHLQYLRDNDYQVIAIEQAYQALEQQQPLPAKAVVITFDDGYQNVADNAVPLLQKFNMPYAIFVNPDLLEQHQGFYMGWDTLDRLSQNGATIVNHGQSHAHLIRRQAGETAAQWQARMDEDINGAQASIAKHISGSKAKMFAYPYGEYDTALEQLLEQWGYISFGQQSGVWSQWSDRQAIPRYPASGKYASIDTLKVKLQTHAMPVVAQQPQDPLLSHANARPTIRLRLAKDHQVSQYWLRCYAGSEMLKPEWQDDHSFSVSPSREIPLGRSRINCTAPAPDGGYFWHSVALIRPDTDGSWPD
ncbi:polysaccharide deacetylase [Idiomarina tyrosinivorans]|uniref:Polysaccharide deacetylase n=1 Tax=Idiomarina tyrosinivorans TaxID=1445662 RepID=A0A432ZTA8_9GAMM|nr:polysaccharide deacetylase family protein [Idiomarina tyrosinivorans]RUO81147.1 polysaccharide deacetylase [Idiomarina tyrosinivorans]